MIELTKTYKIAVIALIFSLIGLGVYGTVQNGINGTNGTNAILGTLVYILHNTSSDVTLYSSLKMDNVIVPDVPKTTQVYSNIPNGDTLIQNWTSLPTGLTLIPAGIVQVHIHAAKISTGGNHIDKLWFDVGIVNATGGNFSSIGIAALDGTITTTEEEYNIAGVMLQKIINTTDRIALRLYVNQTGTGTLPDIQIWMDDLTTSRLTIPAIPIDLTALISTVGNNTVDINLKVDKSGDTMTGNLIMSNNNIQNVSIIGSYQQKSISQTIYNSTYSPYPYMNSTVRKDDEQCTSFLDNAGYELNCYHPYPGTLLNIFEFGNNLFRVSDLSGTDGALAGLDSTGNFTRINYSSLPSDNTKVNISGAIMTGVLNLTSNLRIWGNNGYMSPLSYVLEYAQDNTVPGFNQTALWIQAKDNDGLAGSDFNLNYYNPSSGGGLFYNFITNNQKWIGLDMRPNGLYWRMGMAGTDDFGVTRYSGTGNFSINSANLTISNMAGSGNAYVCVHANGEQYRGSPTC